MVLTEEISNLSRKQQSSEPDIFRLRQGFTMLVEMSEVLSSETESHERLAQNGIPQTFIRPGLRPHSCVHSLKKDH